MMGGFPIEAVRPAVTTPLHMPSRCLVISKTTTYDDYGGETQEETVLADTRCRMEPGGGSEDVFQSAVRNRTSAVVHLPFGVEVETHDPETGEVYHLEVDGRRFSIESIAAQSEGHSVGPVVAVSDID